MRTFAVVLGVVIGLTALSPEVGVFFFFAGLFLLFLVD